VRQFYWYPLCQIRAPSSPASRKKVSGKALLFLVGAFAFGLSVALAMLIFEDDLFAAMPIVVSIAGVAMFVGVRKRRARQHLEQLQDRTRARHAVTERRRLQHPWWEVLETSERATLEEVKAAYRAKVRKYHPDRVNDLATEFQDLADRKMKEINQAYEFACRIKRSTSRR
jgi:DnaJ like chaperone protein